MIKTHTQLYTGLLIVLLVFLALPAGNAQAQTATPVSSETASEEADQSVAFFELSKKERVEKVRQALRNRRENLRNESTLTPVKQDTSTTPLQQAPKNLSILERIIVRYEQTFYTLLAAESQINTYLTNRGIEQTEITATLQTASSEARQAQKHINDMKALAEKHSDIAIVESKEITASFEQSARQAKEALKAMQEAYLSIVQILKTNS